MDSTLSERDVKQLLKLLGKFKAAKILKGTDDAEAEMGMDV